MIILIIHIIVFYDQNISLILYVKDGSYLRLWHPSCVYITAQRQYKRCVHLWNNFPCIITLVLRKTGIFKHHYIQGCNVRKVISELYASFVLQCTVFGRKSKHKTDVTAWHGIHFHKNNLWNILVIENYYVNYQNYQDQMLLSFSDTRRTLMHLFLFTNSAQRELVSICTQSIHNRD